MSLRTLEITTFDIINNIQCHYLGNTTLISNIQSNHIIINDQSFPDFFVLYKLHPEMKSQILFIHPFKSTMSNIKIPMWIQNSGILEHVYNCNKSSLKSCIRVC